MRFTSLNPTRNRPPKFSAMRNKRNFVILAISEVTLLTLLALLLFHFRSISNPAVFASALLVVLGAISVLIRKSAIYAQFIFLISLFAIELILLADVVPFNIEVSSMAVSSAVAFPVIFLIVDIAALWWVIIRGIFVVDSAETQDK